MANSSGTVPTGTTTYISSVNFQDLYDAFTAIFSTNPRISSVIVDIVTTNVNAMTVTAIIKAFIERCEVELSQLTWE